jgi:hypothetical protein
MTPKKISSVQRLFATATPQSSGSTGTIIINANAVNKTLSPTTCFPLFRKVSIFDATETGTWQISDSEVGGSAAYVAAIAQQHYITCVDPITEFSYLDIGITSSVYSGLDDDTLVVRIGITSSSDSNKLSSQLASKLNLNKEFSQYFIASSSSTTLTVKRIIDTYGLVTDATMNVSLTVFSGVGTAVPTSTENEAGSLAQGVLWEGSDPVDAEGVSVPVLYGLLKASMINCISGEGNVSDSVTDRFIPAIEGSCDSHCNSGTSTGFGGIVTVYCTTAPFILEMTFVALID